MLRGQIVNVARSSKYFCTYCGSPYGVNRDHVIPTCYLREKRRYEGDWLVACCTECNSTLGDNLIFNVPDRAAWVAAHYRQKYRKVLNAPRWSEDEIDELRGNLRKKIRGAVIERKEMEERIRHLDLVAGLPISYKTELRPAIDPGDEDVPEYRENYLFAHERRRELTAKARAQKRISMENRVV